MKRIVVFSIVLAMLVSLLMPVAAYAADGNNNGNQGNGNNNNEKYAIIIGVSDYPGPLNVLQGGLDLFYADDDANAMRTALVTQGFRPGNISVLVNSNATKENILDKIHEVRDEAGKNDKVVFYFAGHAVIPEAQFPSPVAGLWPNNAPTVSDIGIVVWGEDGQTAIVFDKELQQAFSGFKTNRIVFGFDTCWAARFNEVAGPGRVVIMASGSTPDAITGEYGEAYAMFGIGPLPGIGWMNQGFFTYFFAVQGLTQKKAPDTNGNKVISVQEAFNYAQPILTQWSSQFAGFINEIPVMIDGSNGDFHL